VTATQGHAASSGGREDLLALALSRPAEALAEALRILAEKPAPTLASVAHQAAGIVMRDFGNIDAAVAHLRSAARFARRAGDDDREADARASLGVALVMAGQPRRGLATLDAVVEAAGDGVSAARHLVRRAHVLWLLGRNGEALRDARRAVAHLLGAGEPVWLARAYNHCAMARLAMGDVEQADRDYARC
jgi:tetratricopeptide (TPR) repeat protein